MVETKYGRIEGVDQGDCILYKGIPYAKPPVGELRWKAPQEPEPWDGVLEATDFRGKCMQTVMSDDPLYGKEFYQYPEYDQPMSEDCLYLHIWTPKDAQGGKLPVAFWIHGGGFMGGYAAEIEFDGAEYCRRGVILVSVEYRCGVFGFLAHPWLSAENERHISGNWGILDQIAALTWVYENIGAFGGDPENITVFGQSAGAMSTQTLVSTDLTGNMIAKAIMQSGGSYGGGLHEDITLEAQEANGVLLAELLGADSLEALRSVPAETLLAVFPEWAKKVPPREKILFMTPTLDHYVLDDTYYGLMDAGRIRDIPYLLGTTKDDILVTPQMRRDGTFSELYEGVTAFSEKLQELGRKPAYVYYFDRDLPGDASGAFHSAELWYSFGTLGRCWRPMEERDYDLSGRMLDYWTDFMKTGDPNGSGHDRWEPCTAENPVIFALH